MTYTILAVAALVLASADAAETRRLRPFIRAWGVNLNKDGSCGTKFRIPVEEGRCYGAKTIPRVDGTCRFLDASGQEYRRFRLSEQRRWFYPPPGATKVEVTLDSEARLEFWEDFEPPRVPVPHPDPLGYCDTTTNMPTDRFQREIDAAAAKGGGTVRVPSGVWHVKPIVLKSNVTLEFAKGAVLLASTDRGDYDPVPRRRAFIYAEDAENVAMRGEGVIDGRGYAFRETGDMSDGSSQPQTLPKLMCFNRCRNVSLEGFTYRRGGAWGCHLCNCYGVTMRRVKCFNHINAMNDGIDIESCNVLIEDCDIDADDDAIAVKAESDKSFAVTNIVIRNCRLASMAYPFKIGTGSYSDVRDILVENCKFPRTKMNHRFAWSKIVAGITNDISGICGIGIQCVDGGRLENVTVRNVEVEGYGVPLAIRLGRRHEPPDGKATFLRNVLVENIDAIAEGPTASSIVGSKGLEIENVTLRNLKVRLAGGATALDVEPVCPNEKGYPGPNMFRSILPASGLFVQDARGVVLDGVDFSLARPDERPLVVGPVSKPGYSGVVDGSSKETRSEPKAMQDAKRSRLEALKELGPTITDFEVRRKKAIAGKRAAFYIDDVIFCFRDLAQSRPKSIWDHFYFAAFKEAHDKYGLKVQMNVFYRNDFYYGARGAEFTLSQMPDTWKAEFQAAKDWLRFGFHSYSEFPDYPWINASYDDVVWTWKKLEGEVERFAGPGMFAKAVTPHWGPMSKEGCVALKDCGAKAIWCSAGKRYEYDGDRTVLPYGHGMRIENFRKPETAVFWRRGGGDDISVSACGYNHFLPEQVAITRGTFNWLHDNVTGCDFMTFGCGAPVLNLIRLEDIPARMGKVVGNEFLVHATHEEYWFKDYFAYQPDSREKLLAACKVVHDAGYEYSFIEEKVDW